MIDPSDANVEEILFMTDVQIIIEKIVTELFQRQLKKFFVHLGNLEKMSPKKAVNHQ